MQKTSYLLFLLLLTSCLKKPLILPTATPEKIVKALLRNQEGVKRIKGLAKVSIRENGRRESSLVNIEIKEGKLARFAFLNLFYQPAYYFVLNYDNLYFYPANLSYVKSGFPNKNTLTSVLGIAVSPNYITNIFMGKLPPGVLGGSYKLRYSGMEYVLDAYNNGRRWEIRCRMGDLLPVFLVEFGKNKKPLLYVRWKNWKQFGEHLFPSVIEVHNPLEKNTVLCKYRKVIINQQIDDKSFFPSFPKGTVVENINS